MMLDAGYAFVIARNQDGSCTLMSDAPDRIRVTQELLNCADPIAMHINAQGDVEFTLSNAHLQYRRVGLVDGDSRIIEFERVY